MLEALETPGSNVPFPLEPILAQIEGGHYVVPILLGFLTNLLAGCTPDGGSKSGAEKKNQRLAPLGGPPGADVLQRAPDHPIPLTQGKPADLIDGDGPTHPVQKHELH